MNLTWGLLSKYKNELYGFCIIWIILFHGLELKSLQLNKIFSFLDGFIRHGNCAVDTFLFLSGICLYFSLQQDSDVFSYYKRRLSKILFPFILIDGIYWFYTCIFLKQDVVAFIKNITFYSFWVGKEKLVWFIALIVVLYAIYPYIFKYILNNENAFYYILSLIIIVYVICLGVNVICHEWFYRVEIALVRVPVFLLGCYCGRLVYENKSIDTWVKILSLLGVLYGAFYFYEHPYSLVKTYRVPYLFIGSSIAIWVSIVLECINNVRINRMLCNWGGLSLELYLSHVVLRKLFVKSDFYTGGAVHKFYMYIVFVFMGSFVISWLVRKVNNFLK